MLALTPAPSAASAVTGGARYYGATSQQQPLLLVLSTSGGALNAVITAVAYDHRCKSDAGSSIYYIKVKHPSPIRRNRFVIDATATRSGGKDIPVRISGSFVHNRHRVTGTIAATGGWAHCPPPRTANNPFYATFNVTAAPAAGP